MSYCQKQVAALFDCNITILSVTDNNSNSAIVPLQISRILFCLLKWDEELFPYPLQFSMILENIMFNIHVIVTYRHVIDISLSKIAYTIWALPCFMGWQVILEVCCSRQEALFSCGYLLKLYSLTPIAFIVFINCYSYYVYIPEFINWENFIEGRWCSGWVNLFSLRYRIFEDWVLQKHLDKC